MVYKPGYKTITSQLYSHDDPMLDTDAQFGVTRALIASYVRHEPGDEPAPGAGRDRALVHAGLRVHRGAGRSVAAHAAGIGEVGNAGGGAGRASRGHVRDVWLRN